MYITHLTLNTGATFSVALDYGAVMLTLSEAKRDGTLARFNHLCRCPVRDQLREAPRSVCPHAVVDVAADPPR